MDMIKYPLSLGVGEDNVIFNNQCYDNDYFKTYLSGAVASNGSFTLSGYRASDRRCSSVKDPKTGEVFKYEYAMNTLYFRTFCSRFKLKRIIASRVSGLSVVEAECFIPGNALEVGVNDFVKCITRKHRERLTQMSVYEGIIRICMQYAAKN